MASRLCFQMFSILCSLLSRLEASHVTGNVFYSFMCSQSLLNFASVWLLGLLLSKRLLCTLCLVLQETSMPTPLAPGVPLPPFSLSVVFVLEQAMEASSRKVSLMRLGSLAGT